MRFLLMVCGIAVFAASLQAGEVIKLPDPQKTGGADVLKAIDLRASASGAEFPKGKLDRQDLSTLLWAASGLNRGQSDKWTVPMAMGRPPYTKVYVTDKEGVYLYDWQSHSLVVVGTDGKVHGSLPIQGFAKTASTNIYMVPDMTQLSGSSHGEEWGVLLAGAMSQNIYLAAEAIGVGARLVYSIERDRAKEAFGLEDGETALFAIILGKK